VPFLSLLLTQSTPAAPSNPVDPDWLLSSTVQSAAVLVAIVGGFLVSRLVTLSAERGGVIQRRRHRDEMRKIKQAEYNEVHDARLEVSTEWFVDHHRDAVLRALGETDVEALLEEFIPRGSSDQEMRPVAENLISSTRSAFAEINSKFPRDVPPLTSRELRQSGVTIPEGSEDSYEAVANYIDANTPREPRGGGLFNFDFPYTPSSLVVTPPIVYERQDALISKEADICGELRALEKEMALLNEELSEFGKPEGVRASICVLAYLTLVGIVLPTILMALRPVPGGWITRVLVVAAFISGLFVLLGYLLLRLQALKPPELSTKCQRRWGRARSGLGDTR
jgi:hypothetical protein